MEINVDVYGKSYNCHCIEQSTHAKGTRYKAYGSFNDHYIEAQEPSFAKAVDHLKRKAEISLD